MPDWTYIVGETNFNQDFAVFNQATNEIIDLTGSTLTMFIKNSKQDTDYPIGGTAMTIVTVENNTLARLNVLSSFMPQVAGQYLAQIQIVEATTNIKTFSMDLQVLRSMSS